MKRTERLSARAVASIVAPGMYADGLGLYLQVRPSENSGPPAKSWIFRYGATAGERYMGLGSVSTVSLAAARAAATGAREQRRQGIDPIDARGAAKAAAGLAQSKTMTFREAGVTYIASHRAGWSSVKHAAQWEKTLAAYAFPIIGGLEVRVIDTGHVLKILEPMWTEKTVTAKRLRGRIESVLDWCKVRGYRDGENPARWRGHLDHLLAAPSKVRRVRHHPALPYNQAPAFLDDLRTRPGMSSAAIEFIIFTAARASEAVRAKPTEFDLAAKVWTIPAERMKAKREHRVPLSDAAVKLIRPLIEIAQRDGFIFTGRRGGPLRDMALAMTLRRMGYVDAKGEEITTHGFRSTFRDWAAERTNFANEVIEMALAHAIGDKVEAAYRRGELFEKRRKLMGDWAKYCATPAALESNKVVALREGPRESEGVLAAVFIRGR
jgi:integrase